MISMVSDDDAKEGETVRSEKRRKGECAVVGGDP